MAHTCSKCNRVNPPEAIYCYYDGMILDGHGRNGGPVPIGAKPFPNQFVFPSGRACRNFDELALACQQDWKGARSLLEEGYLESFLSGLGRADLALSAREAARFPDRDRGLDQFLANLPSAVLQPPQLQVEPREVNLGQMQVGQDRKFDLQLDNAGKRLVYGTVTVEDCPWLSVGDGAGAGQKLFQFGDSLTIPVHVNGKRFRASNKPIEGRLVVESSGGEQTVTVRVTVPVKSFSDGVLAGAKSPRQIAEKAKEKPKESAVLFEKGAVARWYKENGWTYPVQAPSSSGLGAVQQFFEALGLTPPPKVDISERSIALKGNPGEKLRHTLEIKAQEKRPVWAHAASDQAWLEVGRAQLNGRTATIPLVVPNVPRRDGETLSAKVTVTSNGMQRFVVPVTLTIGGNFAFGAAVPVMPVDVPAPVVPQTIDMEPLVRRPRHSGFNWLHLLPLLLLFLAVGGVFAWDLIAGMREPEKAPPVVIQGGDGKFQWTDINDHEPRLGISFMEERLRFGIVMLKDKDPDNPDKKKKLTYEERGDTNNTCLKIDGKEGCLYWQKPGKPVRGLTEFSKFKELEGRKGWTSTWEFVPESIHCTQTIELVPGETSRVFDTVLVRYTLHNRATIPHTVGLRVMLDTYIGANDGVPFAIPIPGQSGLMNTMIDLDHKDIPDYIQAIEHEDLKNPGTVAHMGLKGISLPGTDTEVEPISRLVICRWPAEYAGEVRWEWDYKSMHEPNHRRGKDSCVALYWAYRNMSPNEKRELAFTYGLNTIATGSGGDFGLGLTLGPPPRKNGKFTLTCYVKNPQRNQKVTLDRLPSHLQLAKGETYEKTVDKEGDRTQVSWGIECTDVGPFELKVSSGSASQSIKGQVRAGGIFGR